MGSRNRRRSRCSGRLLIIIISEETRLDADNSQIRHLQPRQAAND